MSVRPALRGSVTLLLFLGVRAPVATSAELHTIQVVDEQTGRGVPLVELRTVNDIRYYTDSAGIVAIDEPGLMNRDVFFHVSSHGYEFSKDGFGYRGTRLRVTPAGKSLLKVGRLNIAERLYRVTGGGIYRDSVLAGEKPPLKHPLLNGSVFGSDSVVNAVYRGQVYWFWGDTNRPGYPLGNFHVPGATSRLPSDGGLDPETGVDLKYFVDESGFARPTARMPGKGPTWIDGLTVVKDEAGDERMFAKYVKVEAPLNVYERGLVEFNHETEEFEKRATYKMDAPLYPAGHPLKHVVGGIEYVYFAQPYPLVRVKATARDLQDLGRYEVYSCFKLGGREDSYELDRDETGQLRFAWKANTIALTPRLQDELIKSGRMTRAEAFYRIKDVETGRPVRMHRGSVYWNAFRKRWIMIAVESLGTSPLGEIWYAEASDPVGPWLHARKIVTHDKYSFYNPKHHPMFDKRNGQIIFFEGTYTNTFSGNPDRTPRYNYNQIMYKLDLADPRLNFATH